MELLSNRDIRIVHNVLARERFKKEASKMSDKEFEINIAFLLIDRYKNDAVAVAERVLERVRKHG